MDNHNHVVSTFPCPTLLIDQVMPTLRDTEWRLLLIVVRQTQGWIDHTTGRRKDRDWLTQTQLKRRSGRNSGAVSKAVEALVQRRLICVFDEMGNSLTSAAARRQARGRMFYGIGPALKWLFPSQVSSKSEVRKPHTTINTDTTSVVFGNRTGLLSVDNGAGAGGCNGQISDDVKAFIALYSKTLIDHTGNTAMPSIDRKDFEHVERLIRLYSFERLSALLSLFFSDRIDYGRGHDYTLGAFTDCVHILASMQIALRA